MPVRGQSPPHPGAAEPTGRVGLLALVLQWARRGAPCLQQSPESTRARAAGAESRAPLPQPAGQSAAPGQPCSLRSEKLQGVGPVDLPAARVCSPIAACGDECVRLGSRQASVLRRWACSSSKAGQEPARRELVVWVCLVISGSQRREGEAS